MWGRGCARASSGLLVRAVLDEADTVHSLCTAPRGPERAETCAVGGARRRPRCAAAREASSPQVSTYVVPRRDASAARVHPYIPVGCFIEGCFELGGVHSWPCRDGEWTRFEYIELWHISEEPYVGHRFMCGYVGRGRGCGQISRLGEVHSMWVGFISQ